MSEEELPVSHCHYMSKLNGIYERTGAWLSKVTMNFPRHQAELDVESWERLQAAVKFFEDLRTDMQELIRSDRRNG